MNLTKKHLLLICAFILLVSLQSYAQPNYLGYHKGIIETEQLMVEHRFEEALSNLHSIFNSYDFVFLRDLKIATQLALIVNDTSRAVEYLKSGIGNGWTRKQIRKNKLTRPLLGLISEKHVDSLATHYHQRMDKPWREDIHEMFKMDQKMAIKALFRIGQQAKIRYAEEKFAPHSEKQMARVIEILKTSGYPGEQLIGNNVWMSTILSHHNSISSDYNKKDTLYSYLRPKLLSAIEKGQMSPFEFALIDNWKIASESNHTRASYGYLGPDLDTASVKTANELRKQIGLRSIELRNSLIDIQTETGINFYLPGEPWQNGKIVVTNENHE